MGTVLLTHLIVDAYDSRVSQENRPHDSYLKNER